MLWVSNALRREKQQQRRCGPPLKERRWIRTEGGTDAVWVEREERVLPSGEDLLANDGPRHPAACAAGAADGRVGVRAGLLLSCGSRRRLLLRATAHHNHTGRRAGTHTGRTQWAAEGAPAAADIAQQARLCVNAVKQAPVSAPALHQHRAFLK